MSRLPRIVLPGFAHHATQRGNNRQAVFLSADDCRVYLHCLSAHSEKYGLQIGAYCLMPNHIHVIGVPARDESLAKALGRAHYQYTNYFNDTHGRSGHLWQNRYFSCPMDEAHTFDGLRYVEQNPVRAGLARQPWDYLWSSAAAHCGLARTPALLRMADWWEHWPPEEWREVLRVRQEEGVARMIGASTLHGRPLGTDSFVQAIEERLGLSLRPLARGRPRASDK